MISKKTFVEVLKLIKEQSKVYEKVNDALELISDSYVMVGTKDKNLDALLMVLSEVFDDKENGWISWWLWEDVEKYVYYENPKRKKSVKTTEKLYDFLIETMEEKKC